MGYYTTHTIKTYPEHCTPVVSKAFYDLDDFDCFNGESIKWYDCDQDCLKVSKLHPSVLFSVYGDGEEKGDLWRKDYMDGQCVGEWKAEPISVPDADPELIAQSIEENPLIEKTALMQMSDADLKELQKKFFEEAQRRKLIAKTLRID